MKDTLTAFYDLEISPVSYDFVVFMVKAELARRELKLKKLHVVIVPFADGMGGMFRDKSQFYDEHEAKWRLWNICIPACALIGASVTLATDWEQAAKLEEGGIGWPKDWNMQTLRTRPHLIGGIITAAKAGVEIPTLRCSDHARRVVRKLFQGRRIVTMTQRHTYLNGRNTVPSEWAQAQEYISGKDCAVVMIKDVGTALAQGGGFAELSIDLRMAMYEEAELNLVANNGCASLCWFSDRPYRMFDAGVGDTRREWEGLFVEQGLPWGSSFTWSSTQQRIIYKRSSADVIIEEFESWHGSSDHRNG